MEPLLLALAILGILVGLVGVVVPLLPGLVLIWAATAGSLLLHRADVVGWLLTAVLTVLLVLGSAATIWLPARKGRQGGASGRSLLYATVGAIVGFFLLPVLGFLVGGLAGLLVGEQQRLGAWGPARDATLRVLRAYGVGVVIELVLGLSMALVWFMAVLLRT